MASAVGVMVPLTCGHKVRARDRRMGYAYGISYRVHVEGLDPAASADEEPVVLRHRVYPTARDARRRALVHASISTTYSTRTRRTYRRRDHT